MPKSANDTVFHEDEVRTERQEGVTGGLSARKRQKVFLRDNYRCVLCGIGTELTVDHLRPRAKGGTNAYTNLQTLCGPCNRRKGQSGTQAVIAQSVEQSPFTIPPVFTEAGR